MVRNWCIAIALSLSLAGLAGVASAAPKATKAKSLKPVGHDDCAKARKKGKPCKITFQVGDDLEGGVATGSGEQVTARGEVVHSSLIRVRTSFRDLIIRTAENL